MPLTERIVNGPAILVIFALKSLTMNLSFFKYKKSIVKEALRSSMIISAIAYSVFRIMFIDFSLGWKEEGFFFLKFFFSAALSIAFLTLGITWLYISLLKLKKTSKAMAKHAK